MKVGQREGGEHRDKKDSVLEKEAKGVTGGWMKRKGVERARRFNKETLRKSIFRQVPRIEKNTTGGKRNNEGGGGRL